MTSSPDLPPAPATWAWASAPQATQTVETEPLEYHRLLRGVQGYKWWKPLVILGLAGAFFLIMTIALSIAFIPIILAVDPSYLDDLRLGTTEIIETQRPISVVLALLSVIIMIPSVLLAMMIMGVRPTSRVWSVALRIRWGLLGRTTLFAILGVVVMNIVGVAFEAALEFYFPSAAVGSVAEYAGDSNFDPSAALLSFLFVLLLVPLQATAEEVVFRGLFMQVLGSWLKNPWFAILIPSVGFAMAHIYDFWGLAAVGLMGAVAAWLTWRTGGLEAAIAIHVINNLVAFGFMTAGLGGSTAQTESAGGVGSVVGEAVGLGLFAWLVVRSFKKHGYGRARIDLKLVPIAPGSLPVHEFLPSPQQVPQVEQQEQPRD
ncbi:CPBP family intramembrane metalloprotease [Leucobacter insecticola]|uniref:CPBP family intramembrane metalloprotease n=1 Tax=Leucobacter insecticola TaxID=2714934 RepID=A0A6G8FGP9_9MICO|nr:CPBP family intramembrane glutamic endopeptidase [Leucobacter insecticola]QIM15686.1 CPBP family intramembrane metalloprotease [Leucobacter insecticola]